MPNEVAVRDEAKAPVLISAIEKALIEGDLSKLTPPERIAYYVETCRTAGLNPASKPFDYVLYQGKLKLYPNAACAEQLRSRHGVTLLEAPRRFMEGETYVVEVHGKDNRGREDWAQGRLVIGGMKGQELENAKMKCETKAKRRLAFSICGLGYMTEGAGPVLDLDPEQAAAHAVAPPEPIPTQVSERFSDVEEADLSEEVPATSQDADQPRDWKAALPKISREQRETLVKHAQDKWLDGAQFEVKEILAFYGLASTLEIPVELYPLILTKIRAA